MASVFGTIRSYHNQPEKSELYKNISDLILATHQEPKEDLKVVQDIVKDLKKYLKNV